LLFQKKLASFHKNMTLMTINFNTMLCKENNS
jgi:hypothetical protein